MLQLEPIKAKLKATYYYINLTAHPESARDSAQNSVASSLKLR